MSKAEENVTDFSFESILFESPRMGEAVEIRNSVTDLDIFEHISKPYLTAVIAFQDAGNFVSGTDILGGETITIKLKSSRNESESIVKTFFIDTIKSNAKQNDNVQFVVLHLIEDVAYAANLKTISRSYEGKCTEILNKIAEGYLDGKEVYSTETDYQSIKVIVPYLNPLEAMQWISNRATTVDGYPFYLYSTLVGEKLKFADLGSLISQNAMNKDIPYRFYQGAVNSSNRDVQRRIILDYQQRDTEDLFTLIKKGLVGSNYTYLNTSTNQHTSFHFDVTADLLQPLIDNGVLNKTQGNVQYSPDYTLGGKAFNELDSKFITQIGGSSTYEEVNSLFENVEISDYKLNIIARAMHNFLQKAPMQVDLNGLDFIDGDVNAGTGNIITLHFLKSQPEDIEGDGLDTKTSGDYLITATQYMFKREKCNVRLSCAKLGNRRL